MVAQFLFRQEDIPQQKVKHCYRNSNKIIEKGTV